MSENFSQNDNQQSQIPSEVNDLISHKEERLERVLEIMK